ncbi:Hint domain-containing protein, partial [Cribrihabitans sp. XS_ASV171]
MSDFSYVNFAVYFSNDGTFVFSSGTSGTIADGDDDNQFEVGDLSPQGTFEGTTTINGIVCPVFLGGGGTSFVYFPSDPGDLTGTNYQTNLTSDPFPFCFMAGTEIETADGTVTVENLCIGDFVKTADGRIVRVKWIGRQTLLKLFTPGERFVPVRVKAGALGDGLPHTDLVLTADHALILDGLAINAGALVNGTTIVHEPIESLPERVTYYHVETEDHDVILANGAPAETYVDY